MPSPASGPGRSRRTWSPAVTSLSPASRVTSGPLSRQSGPLPPCQTTAGAVHRDQGFRILLDAVYGISTMRETGQIPERAFGRSLTMRG